MQKKTNKILFDLLKFAIAFLSFYYIFLKLQQYNFKDFFFSFDSFFDYFAFISLIVLMPLNWFIEAIKWKFLVRNFEEISSFKSIKAVISGITFAIFTPNRIGELGGRVFVLKKENRTKGVFATATGSLSQMMITVILGVIGGVVLLIFFENKLHDINSGTLIFVKLFSLAILIFGIFILFNLTLFVKLLKKLKLPANIISAAEIISSYKKYELFRILFFSFLRYLVFSFQFYLLLLFFNVDISYSVAILSITLTYFVSSVIPSFTLTEIGIRGTAAIFFIGLFSENIAGIIAATAILWIINLAIPAVIGSLLFYWTKI